MTVTLGIELVEGSSLSTRHACPDVISRTIKPPGALDRGSDGGPLGADRSVTSHDNFLRGHGNAGSHI
jgi:hypothetical protein